MGIFQDVIQGPYLFILIALVLIVAGLALFLIWLVMQNVLQFAANAQPEGHASSDSTAQAHGAAPPAEKTEAGTPAPAEALGAPPLAAAPPEQAPAAAVAAAPAAVRATGEAIPEDVTKPAGADEVAAEEVKKLTDESTILKDKVKYLESRLMEYEIVQEEISNLSLLRVENEKLKEELLKVQGGKPQTPPVQDPSGIPPAAQPNPVTESVSQNQIDSILQKLDEVTSKPETKS